MQSKCPQCEIACKPVKPITVESMLRPPVRSDVAEHDWAFCAAPKCSVIYFSTYGTQLMREDLKVRVGAKEEPPPHTVCYCFGHSVESILEEVRRSGKSTVVDSVTKKMQTGQCTCEVMNPKGSCCLGDLRATVQEALSVAGSKANLDDNTNGCGE